MSTGASTTMQPLELLSGRFQANLRALAARDEELAKTIEAVRPAGRILLHAAESQVTLARQMGNQVEEIPCRLTPAAADEVAKRIYPSGQVAESSLVAGIDQGWLWHALYSLPCAPSRSPGYRAPLYFAAQDPEELWIAMHLHDWRALLSDLRARLFVGPDAIDRLLGDMKQELLVPWPRLSVTLDPRLWSGGRTLESLIGEAVEHQNAELIHYQQLNEQHMDALPAAAIAARLSSAKKLRVLGITSRYTTVLQYSMRDWLAAFESLGHETRLLIEQHDHELPTNLVQAKACAEFNPDLVLIIDHFRAEMSGLPERIPCVMWIQDCLPNIFAKSAGAAQGERDYVIGYGKMECVQHFGYPAERFMPCTMAVNTRRFAPAQTPSEFACDLSFVSHASKPAEVLIREQMQANASQPVRRLLDDIFQRMRAVYEAGGALTHALQVQAVIDQAMIETGLHVNAGQLPALRQLFVDQINNALYRHQSLHWAADLDINIRLYGRGWESHPRFGRYAKGVADNQRDLCSIYRSSRINLQLTPLGAMHQRLLEGLSAGGFFLLRRHPGDLIGRIFPSIHQWCIAHGIKTQDELAAGMNDHVRSILGEATQLLGLNPLAGEEDFVQWLEFYEQLEYASCASSVFGSNYDAVAFSSRPDMHGKITRFLQADDERRRIAADMRHAVIKRFSYEAITHRLLQFIASNLATQSAKEIAA